MVKSASESLNPRRRGGICFVSVESAWLSQNPLRRLGIRLAVIEPVSPSLNLLCCRQTLTLSKLGRGLEICGIFRYTGLVLGTRAVSEMDEGMDKTNRDFPRGSYS